MSMKSRVIFFLALIATVTVFLPGSPNAVSRSDIENEGLDFVNTLSSLSRQKKLLANYRPWLEAYLIIDRNRPERFVSINLKCPHSASCTQLAKTKSGIIALSGTWPRPLPLPANRNYEYFYRDNMVSGNTMFEFFSMNPGVRAILGFVLPRQWQGSDYPGAFETVYLHEGFHEFVQFAGFYGIPSSWSFDLTELKSVHRNDSSYCRDLSHPAVLAEYAAQKSFVDALARKAKLDVLEVLFVAWDQLKTERYRILPSAPPQNGISTNCEKLDQVYERIEGLADYVAFAGLIEDKQISLGQVAEYFNQALLNDPREALTPDLGFYAAGATYAFFLERLDATGSWKSRIVLGSLESLRRLVQEKIKARTKADEQ